MLMTYKTVLLKISGEALASSDPASSIDLGVVDRFTSEIVEARRDNPDLRLGIVVGGGNIWRGAKGEKVHMDRTPADHMGMLATVINALALGEGLKRHGEREPRVMSALSTQAVAEDWIIGRALKHLEKNRVIVCGAGLGETNFTTDTAAVQRARHIKADILLKGTHGTVDGIYTADPNIDPTATRFDEITFSEVIRLKLDVMDRTAFTHAEEAELPIRVFNMMKEGSIYRALTDDPDNPVGSLIKVG